MSETKQRHGSGCVSCPNYCWSVLIAVISWSLEQHQPEPAVCCCYPTLLQHWFLWPSHKYTHTHTRMHAHTDTHTRMHINTHAHANTHTHTHAHTHTQSYIELACTAHAHTFRCAYFGMQGVEWECSLALTGEAVWQAKNKTRKWRLEMCLVFSLTFPLGSLYGANR